MIGSCLRIALNPQEQRPVRVDSDVRHASESSFLRVLKRREPVGTVRVQHNPTWFAFLRTNVTRRLLLAFRNVCPAPPQKLTIMLHPALGAEAMAEQRLPLFGNIILRRMPHILIVTNVLQKLPTGSMPSRIFTSRSSAAFCLAIWASNRAKLTRMVILITALTTETEKLQGTGVMVVK